MNLTPLPPVGATPIVPHPLRGGGLMTEEASFLQELFGRAGLDAGAYRSETLRRRLPACLRALRATSIRQARQVLEKTPELASHAVEATVIGVTNFFRDHSVFADLVSDVLPILAGRRGALRIWSAGCSDGNELYSAAILLSEASLLNRGELLGTDCRACSVARARQARYEAQALRDVSSVRLREFFGVHGTHYEVVPALRHRTQWRRSDVTSLTEPGPWDLIFCRNLTMYLQPAVASGVWQRMEQALRPGGFLVLGKAERPVGANRLAQHAPCIYRKVV